MILLGSKYDTNMTSESIILCQKGVKRASLSIGTKGRVMRWFIDIWHGLRESAISIFGV